MIRIFFVTLLLFSIVSCKTINQSGVAISDKQIQSLKSGIDKNDVIDIIGSPSFTPLYSDNKWYYIYSSNYVRGFSKPKVENIKILILSFNNDKLQDVKIDMIKEDNYDILKDRTNFNTNKLNPIQEYISNFGRFRK